MRLRQPPSKESAKRRLQNRVFHTYKYQAKQRRLRFSLERSDFFALLEAPCHYCEAPPSNIQRDSRVQGSLRYQGIDRVENRHGYELWNCVPCCAKCNSIKADDLTYDEMLMLSPSLGRIQVLRQQGQRPIQSVLEPEDLLQTIQPSRKED